MDDGIPLEGEIAVHGPMRWGRKRRNRQELEAKKRERSGGSMPD